MLLSEKYEPKAREELAGDMHIDKIKSWVKNRKKGCGLILWGPSGSGKTTAVKIAARELGYRIINTEKNGDISGIFQKNIFGQQNMIVIDSESSNLKKTIEESSCPLIIITENAYELNKETRALCDMIEFKKILVSDLIAITKRICNAENFLYEEPALSHIARISNGNAQAAITALDILKPKITNEAAKNLHSMDYYNMIFETLRVVFRSTSIENIKIALANSERTEEEILPWIEENICNEFENIEDIAVAFEQLAKGSIFGLPPSRKNFVKYNYPKSRKQGNNNDIDDIAKKMHMSKRKAMMYMKKIIDD